MFLSKHGRLIAETRGRMKRVVRYSLKQPYPHLVSLAACVQCFGPWIASDTPRLFDRVGGKITGSVVPV